MNRCAQCGGKFGLIRHRWYSRQFCSLRCRGRLLNQLAKDRDSWLDFLKAGSATARRVMKVQSRHWLDYDSVALVVLVVGMSAAALLALSI